MQGVSYNFHPSTNCNLKDIKFPSNKLKIFLFCFVLALPLRELKSHSSHPEAEPLCWWRQYQNFTCTFHRMLKSHRFFSITEKVIIVVKLEINKIFKRYQQLYWKKLLIVVVINKTTKDPDMLFQFPFGSYAVILSQLDISIAIILYIIRNTERKLQPAYRQNMWFRDRASKNRVPNYQSFYIMLQLVLKKRRAILTLSSRHRRWRQIHLCSWTISEDMRTAAEEVRDRRSLSTFSLTKTRRHVFPTR